MKLYNPLSVSEAKRQREEVEKNLQNVIAMPETIEEIKQQNATLKQQNKDLMLAVTEIYEQMLTMGGTTK